MTKYISFLAIFTAAFDFYGQLTSSNLPIVVINTQGAEIPDEPKINGTMGIIYDPSGGVNSVNGPFSYFSGNIGIETRGNSTQEFDKKTYSLELRTAFNEDTSVNLFGMGGEEDWILHAMVIDKSQVRIPMTFYLSQRMGHYSPEWKYVELIVNGDYRGLYAFMEKIKRDDDRVDIAKMDEDDLSGDSLTGGYILRIDWLDDPQGFSSNYNSQGGVPMFFQWYYPKASKIKAQQASYIENWMDSFEEALFSSDYTNSSGFRYTDYIDVNSFTDFVLINELSKNADGYKLSSYVHKDTDSKGGKLLAGPIWDFDQTYGVSTVCSGHLHTGWTYLQNQLDCEDLESMPMWWQTMMQDPSFQNRLKCRWTEFRSSFLHTDSVMSWINTDTTYISDAIARNFQKWDDFIGGSIWIEPSPIPQTYEEEISTMKSWITNRLDWMDANMPGNCANDDLSVDHNELFDLEIYPNPASNRLFISYDHTKDYPALRILDSQGRMVRDFPRFNQNFIDLNGLRAGLYYLEYADSNRMVLKKFMILD